MLTGFSGNLCAGDEVTGSVRDKATGKPLVYATVSVAGGAYGVISDESGAFRLELDGGADTIVISYVGYKTLRLSPADLKRNPECALEPYVFSIDEVVVTPLDAERILRLSYDAFYDNHVHPDMATYGYYREQIFEDEQCVRFGEAVFATRFYEKDGRNLAALEPYLARSADDSTFLKKLNDLFNSRRMIIPVGMDAYQDNDLLNSFQVDRYYKFVGDFLFGGGYKGFNVSYSLRENYAQDGRECYYITLDIRKRKTPVATADVLIDRETYGVAAFGIQLVEQENLTKMLLPAKFRLVMKLFGYWVNVGGYEARLYNHYDDGRWFLGRGVQVIRGGIARRGDWINGRIVNEFHAYYSRQYAKPEKQEFLDRRTYDFSPGFWKDFRYAPLQPQHEEYVSTIRARNATFQGEVLSARVRARMERRVTRDE